MWPQRKRTKARWCFQQHDIQEVSQSSSGSERGIVSRSVGSLEMALTTSNVSSLKGRVIKEKFRSGFLAVPGNKRLRRGVSQKYRPQRLDSSGVGRVKESPSLGD